MDLAKLVDKIRRARPERADIELIDRYVEMLADAILEAPMVKLSVKTSVGPMEVRLGEHYVADERAKLSVTTPQPSDISLYVTPRDGVGTIWTRNRHVIYGVLDEIAEAIAEVYVAKLKEIKDAVRRVRDAVAPLVIARGLKEK